MPSSSQLYNSPQKQWLREFFWLPEITAFKSVSGADFKYLTLAGPQGYDIELFTQRAIFQLDNVRVWEQDPLAAQALGGKYGVDFMSRIAIGDALGLSTSKVERPRFPHNVVNLDFTNGAFQVPKPRHIPNKFEVVNNIMSVQREHATSFLLLLAVACTATVDSDYGKTLVQKLAFDIATRLGYTEPLFNLTKNIVSKYPDTLAAVIPCTIIRLGGDNCYDTQCVGKAIYFPDRSSRTGMLCFMFRLTYDHPALSEPTLLSITRLTDVVNRRQEESLRMSLLDVNAKTHKQNTRSTRAATPRKKPGR